MPKLRPRPPARLPSPHGPNAVCHSRYQGLYTPILWIEAAVVWLLNPQGTHVRAPRPETGVLEASLLEPHEVFGSNEYVASESPTAGETP